MILLVLCLVGGRGVTREETNEEMLQFSVSLTQDQLVFQCWVGVGQMKKIEKEFQTDVTDKSKGSEQCWDIATNPV